MTNGSPQIARNPEIDLVNGQALTAMHRLSRYVTEAVIAVRGSHATYREPTCGSR